jgi:hypothetical protein
MLTKSSGLRDSLLHVVCLKLIRTSDAEIIPRIYVPWKAWMGSLGRRRWRRGRQACRTDFGEAARVDWEKLKYH